jgi:hypothetical protein
MVLREFVFVPSNLTFLTKYPFQNFLFVFKVSYTYPRTYTNKTENHFEYTFWLVDIPADTTHSRKLSLTIVHNRYTGFVIHERGKTEYAQFGSQFRVLRLDELDTVSVGIVVDRLEVVQYRFAFVALISI